MHGNALALKAQSVADMLVRMNRESSPAMAAPEISSLILIDRNIDLVTPLLTQVLAYDLASDLPADVRRPHG